MKSADTVRQAFDLRDQGWTHRAIADELAVSTKSLGRWFGLGPAAVTPTRVLKDSSECPDGCALRAAAGAEYAYLLGQYLGDGWIGSNLPRGVHRLMIACSTAYPGIVDECDRAIASVAPTNRVARQLRDGVTIVSCYSKHWPCVFPQHGPGPKHLRPIVLEPWQDDLAVRHYPDRFVRGLVHSDGWRGWNSTRSPSGTVYRYPRYQFTNHSEDILQLFVDACDALGVETKRMNRYNISVNKRDHVARLDEFVGPKQ